MIYRKCDECGFEGPEREFVEVRVFGKRKKFCGDVCWQQFQAREFHAVRGGRA